MRSQPRSLLTCSWREITTARPFPPVPVGSFHLQMIESPMRARASLVPDTPPSERCAASGSLPQDVSGSLRHPTSTAGGTPRFSNPPEATHKCGTRCRPSSEMHTPVQCLGFLQTISTPALSDLEMCLARLSPSSLSLSLLDAAAKKRRIVRRSAIVAESGVVATGPSTTKSPFCA